MDGLNIMKKIYLLLMLFVFSSTALAEPSVIPSGKSLMAAAEKVTTTIKTEDLKAMINNEPDLVLVDIRTRGEINKHGGSIDAPQNINISRGWLEFDIQSHAVSKDTPIVVYCGGGLRSPLAAKTLQDMGYTKVWNYSAGYFGWKKSHAK
jgi:rhodanese-related sulfurtransferase